MNLTTKKVRVEFVEKVRYILYVEVPKTLTTDELFNDEKKLIQHLDDQCKDWALEGSVEERDIERVEEVSR